MAFVLECGRGAVGAKTKGWMPATEDWDMLGKNGFAVQIRIEDRMPDSTNAVECAGERILCLHENFVTRFLRRAWRHDFAEPIQQQAVNQRRNR